MKVGDRVRIAGDPRIRYPEGTLKHIDASGFVLSHRVLFDNETNHDKNGELLTTPFHPSELEVIA